MQEISAKIVKEKIIRVNVEISRELLTHLELSMECRVNVKRPREKEDRSVLLNTKLKLGTQNDDVNIVFDADTIFELTQIPDDYNKIAEQILVPMVKKSLLEKLDDILVSMGYEKMKLAEQM